MLAKHYYILPVTMYFKKLLLIILMNKMELAHYYVNRKNEFMGEAGHEKLLFGLKKHITNIDDTNCKIVGITGTRFMMI